MLCVCVCACDHEGQPVLASESNVLLYEISHWYLHSIYLYRIGHGLVVGSAKL